jgi:hypothetical protein
MAPRTRRRIWSGCARFSGSVSKRAGSIEIERESAEAQVVADAAVFNGRDETHSRRLRPLSRERREDESVCADDAAFGAANRRLARCSRMPKAASITMALSDARRGRRSLQHVPEFEPVRGRKKRSDSVSLEPDLRRIELKPPQEGVPVEPDTAAASESVDAASPRRSRSGRSRIRDASVPHTTQEVADLEIFCTLTRPRRSTMAERG